MTIETRLAPGRDWHAQLHALEAEIERLKSEAPTSEEMAYLRNKKRTDENAAWAWKVLREHVPWITAVGTGLGTLIYWALTHSISIGKTS